MKLFRFPFLILLIFVLITSCDTKDTEAPESSSIYLPEEDLGVLFHDIQTSDLFPDSKTFVDYTPKSAPGDILSNYNSEKGKSGFSLEAFVKENFDPPYQAPSKPIGEFSDNMEEHLNAHWDYLTRQPDKVEGLSTLFSLPHPYVVPGGRFREIYYWDSYFTMLGLAESGRLDLIKGMIDNFSYLIDTLGFIPNGNRTYYRGRSQPPFFASMVSLYGDYAGEESVAEYLAPLQKEYDFWMKGTQTLIDNEEASLRVVRMADGEFLNRYYDNFDTPRPEAYKEDSELAHGLSEDGQKMVYRNLRAAAESGWDFSTRWFEDGKTFSTIVTTNIVPVDLNSLLYNLEKTLSGMYILSGDLTKAEEYSAKAERRKEAIVKYLWDEESKTFRDWNFIRGEYTPVVSLAMMFPLYYEIADQEQATSVAELLENEFLFDGGFVSTLNDSEQQWDYPNGWAPLQWICVQGLVNYNMGDLARMGATKWLSVNERVYDEEKKMMEKYNVIDISLLAGGGEYPSQDGFGWTNGVALKLYSILKEETVESM